MNKILSLFALTLLLSAKSNAQHLYFLLGPDKDTVNNYDNKVNVYLKTKDNVLLQYNKGNKLVLPHVDMKNIHTLVVVYNKDTFNCYDNDRQLRRKEIAVKLSAGTANEQKVKTEYEQAKHHCETLESYLHLLLATGQTMCFEYRLSDNNNQTESKLSFDNSSFEISRPAFEHNDYN